jgi:hypothetical protein
LPSHIAVTIVRTPRVSQHSFRESPLSVSASDGMK